MPENSEEMAAWLEECGISWEEWLERRHGGSDVTEWAEVQCAKVHEAVAAAQGITLGDPGDTVDGEADSQAPLLPEQCNDWNHPVPVVRVLIDDEPRLVYFFQTYAFHPGTAPDNDANTTVQRWDGQREGRIYVVDTGWAAGTTHDLQGRPIDQRDIDPLPIGADIVGGHGPAIVDIIQKAAGTATRADGTPHVEVHLRQVDFWAGMKNSGGHPCIALLELDGYRFRGFDEPALMSTLNRILPELKQDPGVTKVVNLSLSAMACTSHLSKELRNWLQEATQHAHVVVAAGNHGLDVPTWPAAYAHGAGGTASIDRVHAVGSAVTNSGNTPFPPAGLSSFSAFGSWVSLYRNGEDLAVVHPAGYRTWSGTSFAAPRYAVELLPKVEVDSSGNHGVVDVRDVSAVGRAVEAERVVNRRGTVTNAEIPPDKASFVKNLAGRARSYLPWRPR